jgi:hypothetical protein
METAVAWTFGVLAFASAVGMVIAGSMIERGPNGGDSDADAD